jgi:predicted GIY-YIG superfamily endonuclease
MSFNHPDAVIYRLKCLDTLTYYIGSAINLDERIRNHKKKANNTGSKSIIQGGNYEIKILEKIPCNVYTELFPTEQKYLDRYREKYEEFVLNIQNAYKTEKELKEWKHQWYLDNKDLCNKKSAENHEKNKEYYNELKKIRYHTNKKQINAQRAEKIVCECGAIIARGYKSQHITMKKHQNYISKINENKI